jgi:hypothetical protein
MKLSKTQQEIVDKMREGWELRLSESHKVYLQKDGYKERARQDTFYSLKYRKVVEMGGTYMNGQIYRLTEQYKT